MRPARWNLKNQRAVPKDRSFFVRQRFYAQSVSSVQPRISTVIVRAGTSCTAIVPCPVLGEPRMSTPPLRAAPHSSPCLKPGAFWGASVIHADDPLVDAELETFLAYAALMDDGEAETIAAAELRHGGVVTDELRAWRVLQDHAPQVSRITSLGLIKQWGEANQIEGDILRTMLEGMRIRASYVPSQRQPHYAWYKKLFKIDKP